MKTILKINYLLSRKIIIHTSMIINEKWAEVKAKRERLFFFLFFFNGRTILMQESRYSECHDFSNLTDVRSVGIWYSSE